jgi:protein tyrosine/serine phosphatase
MTQRTMALLLLVALLTAACGETPPVAPRYRPAIWAQPIAVDEEHLPNFHQVSDTLYRGAQPSEEGFAQLKAMGVRTIINLRSFHSDCDLIGETGLGYEHIYMKPWHPEDEDVVRFLQIVTSEGRSPAFVHCQRGADRTGTMCAVYRVVIDGWSKEEAILEMMYGGYGYDHGWHNLRDYLEDLDVADIRRQVGLDAR